ncbi:VWA domain-containing protein [Amorphus sp. 3PC139-8]|uniref:VWA domain-containing protein n=1 Tax=Amorphus sp. 3PC139-8 TaxID=2735676 RepID=UPI00345D25B4
MTRPSHAEEADRRPAKRSSRADIDAFVTRAHTLAPTSETRGRLMFALDATMSRQPTWDQACKIQAEMFEETGRIGGLDIQLVYFRGIDECRASRWISDATRLRDIMTRIDCRGGLTQIRKVLRRAIDETRRERVQAVVYVGDSMEENIDELCARAGELGLLKVPVFVFQEGTNSAASTAFAEIARLSGGAHLTFSTGAADELGRLLRAVAVYAAGGRRALADMSARGEEGARLLIGKLG